MKRLCLLFLLLCGSAALMAQRFSCPELIQDIRTWNEYQQPNNYLEWARSVKADHVYKTNAAGALEYVYVMTADRDVDLNAMCELALDYLAAQFKVSAQLRAEIARRSPTDAIFFTGLLKKIGTFYSLTDENYIDTQIQFDIRFKSNRIRFKVTIAEFRVVQTSDRRITQDKTVRVKDAYPLNKRSDHKDSYSKAFLNSNGKMLNYAGEFLNFFNKHIARKQAEEDW